MVCLIMNKCSYRPYDEQAVQGRTNLRKYFVVPAPGIEKPGIRRVFEDGNQFP
jgi:hypothetical protein